MSDVKILETSDICSAILSLKKCIGADLVFFLVDENTNKHCLPIIGVENIDVERIIVIPAEDENKNLITLTSIWNELQEYGATRHSLLINLGGGMVSDIGGFAASTFKRGMHFANIPTTVLAAVDASSGGKTGINYNGFKNDIGAFAFPKAVFINGEFFLTLNSKEVLSGYAEMIKHSLLSDRIFFEQTMSYDIERFDIKRLKYLVEQNIVVKKNIVDADPYEMGKRKALNLGHTIGHAIETISYRKESPVAHGYAVMWGMVGELYLSCRLLKLDKEILASVVNFARTYYGTPQFSCDDYEELLNVMKHDKKNSFGNINFTLLAGVGDMSVNQTVERELILEALDFIREN